MLTRTRALRSRKKAANLSVDTDLLKGSGFDPAMKPDEVANVVRYLVLQAPDAMRGARVEVFG